MRVLFTSHPAYGHLHPLLPLARAVREAGHDVAVATSDTFKSVVESVGFPAIAAGLSWLESDDSSLPEHLRPGPGLTLEAFFAKKFVAAVAEPLARDVISAASEWMPDVIVRERTEYGGALAAAVLGIPGAAIQVASPSLMARAFLDAVATPYNLARRDLGLVPDDGLAQLENQVVFALAPPSLHDPDVALPPNFIPSGRFRMTGRRAPCFLPGLPRWVGAGRWCTPRSARSSTTRNTSCHFSPL